MLFINTPPQAANPYGVPQQNNQDLIPRIFHDICIQFGIDGQNRDTYSNLVNANVTAGLEFLEQAVNCGALTANNLAVNIRGLLLNFLGECFPQFTYTTDRLYNKEVVDSMEIVRGTSARMAGLAQQHNHNSYHQSNQGYYPTHGNYQVQPQPQVSSMGYRPGNNQPANYSNLNTLKGEDIIDMQVSNHIPAETNIPHSTAPYIQPVGPRKNPEAVKVVTVPHVIDMFDSFIFNQNTTKNPNLEMSNQTFQLQQLPALLEKTKGAPALYQFLVEEHAAWGNKVTQEKCDTIFQTIVRLGISEDFDSIVERINDLKDLGRTKTVNWITDRISSDLVSFMERNYGITEIETLAILTKPVECIAWLKDKNIKDVILKRVIFLINELFKESQLFHAQEDEDSDDEETSKNDKVIVLYRTKPLLVLPYYTRYLSRSKTFTILDNHVSPDIANYLIDEAFKRIPEKHNDELLIVNSSLNMYSTHRWYDQVDDISMLYEILPK